MIFLDMDGVIADWEGHVHSLVGADWKDELKQPLWGRINQHPDLYRNLPVLPGAKILFQHLVDKYGERNVRLLTALPYRAHTVFPLCMQHKIEWFHEHFGNHKVPVLFGPYAVDKQKHVKHSTDILIDDMELNIQQWNDAGGCGILHTSVEETLKRV
jgi:5'(3')-deoxyribonucleotidase